MRYALIPLVGLAACVGDLDGDGFETDDCGPNDSAIFPGAPEGCDGVDRNCDGQSNQRDRATLNGEPVDDVVAAVADAGNDALLWLCAGTWPPLAATKDITIVGILGAQETVIDGGGVGPAVTVNGGSIALAGLTLTNGTGGSIDGSAVGCGGGLLAVHSDSVTLQGVVITENTALNGGGACLYDVGDVSIRSSVITGNTAVQAGGGLSVDLTGRLDLSHDDIRENEAGTDGGGLAIYAHADLDIDMSGSFVGYNVARAGGGAMAIGGVPTAALSLFAGEYTHNRAEGDGGGLLVREFDRVSFDSLALQANVAAGSGGGFRVEATPGLDLSRTSIAGNGARFGGGGTVKLGGDTTISGDGGTELYGNEATESGGGLLVFGTGAVALSDLQILYNLGAFSGGLHLAAEGPTTLTRLTLSENAAGSGGGFTLQHHDGPLRLMGTLVDRNHATDGGGGVIQPVTSGDLVLESDTTSRFFGNTAEGFGGGLFYSNYGRITKRVDVSGARVHDNVAARGGGLAIMYGSSWTFSDSEIIDNDATEGAALYLDSEVTSITGGSISGNEASDRGGAVHLIRGVVTATGVDFGVEGTGNTPYDVSFGSSDALFDYQGLSSFVCDQAMAGCE